jgi:hypothetical protein
MNICCVLPLTPSLRYPGTRRILHRWIQLSPASSFLRFWRITECLGVLRKYVTACHKAKLAWGMTAPCNVALLGLALFYSCLALAWDLILSLLSIEESRGILCDHSTFDGFPSQSQSLWQCDKPQITPFLLLYCIQQ